MIVLEVIRHRRQVLVTFCSRLLEGLAEAVELELRRRLHEVAMGRRARDLALEAAVVIGDDGQDGIDLALADERFESAGLEPAGHVADSSAWPEAMSSCPPCRQPRVARSWRGRSTTSPTPRSRPSCSRP